MATYRIDVPASGGTYTAATLSGDCQITNFSTSSSTEFSDMVSDWAYDNNDKIRLTAATNTSSSSRDGYMIVNYSIGGNSCSNTIHLVQSGSSSPTASGFILNIDVPQGKTSPYIQFLDAQGNYLAGCSRVTSDTSTTIHWSANGTCTQMSFSENGGNLTKVSMNNNIGNTLLYNQTLNNGSTPTVLTFQDNRSIVSSEYDDGTKNIYITFT